MQNKVLLLQLVAAFGGRCPAFGGDQRVHWWQNFPLPTPQIPQPLKDTPKVFWPLCWAKTPVHQGLMMNWSSPRVQVQVGVSISSSSVWAGPSRCEASKNGILIGKVQALENHNILAKIITCIQQRFEDEFVEDVAQWGRFARCARRTGAKLCWAEAYMANNMHPLF